MKKLLLSLVLLASFVPVFAMSSDEESESSASLNPETAQSATASALNDALDDVLASATDASQASAGSTPATPTFTAAEKFKANVKGKASSVRTKLSGAATSVKGSKPVTTVTNHPKKSVTAVVVVAAVIYTAKKLYNRYQDRKKAQVEEPTENA